MRNTLWIDGSEQVRQLLVGFFDVFDWWWDGCSGDESFWVGYAEIGFWRFYSLWFCLSFFSELLTCPLTIGGVK